MTRPSVHPHQPAEDMGHLVTVICSPALNIATSPYLFVGPSASELAQLVAIPMKMGATKADFDAVTALHPTLAEEIVTIGEPVERYRRAAAE